MLSRFSHFQIFRTKFDWFEHSNISFERPQNYRLASMFQHILKYFHLVDHKEQKGGTLSKAWDFIPLAENAISSWENTCLSHFSDFGGGRFCRDLRKKQKNKIFRNSKNCFSKRPSPSDFRPVYSKHFLIFYETERNLQKFQRAAKAAILFPSFLVARLQLPGD